MEKRPHIRLAHMPRIPKTSNNARTKAKLQARSIFEENRGQEITKYSCGDDVDEEIELPDLDDQNTTTITGNGENGGQKLNPLQSGIQPQITSQTANDPQDDPMGETDPPAQKGDLSKCNQEHKTIRKITHIRPL